jgi:hypothetical protein
MTRETLARVNGWRKRHNFALIMLWGVALEACADYCTLNDHPAWTRIWWLIVAIWVGVIAGRQIERRYWQPQITSLEADIDHARELTSRAYQLCDQRIREIRAEFERRSQP